MQNSKAKMKKHIVIAKLFDSGGSNTYFKNLISYLGKENVIVIVEHADQLIYLKNIIKDGLFKTKIITDLHPYAHLQYRATTNIKEFFYIIKSLITIALLSVRFGFAPVTISCVEPEKYLYLFWLPFVKVNYVLHSEPHPVMSFFTTFTCNLLLSSNKKVITVSKSMQEIICRNWAIKRAKTQFVILIYNCLLEQDFKKTHRVNNLKKLTVITLGHVDGRKNPDLWLLVAKKITSTYSNVTFCWLGNGPLLDQFKEETKHEGAITFLGLIENPQYFLEQSAIYYQPSIVEPHGIAVIEAMYYKLPCVVSNVGGLPESVKHNYNGIVVEVNNLLENVNAIIELLEDADKRSRYGQNGFKRYHELFSYAAFKEKMDAVYA